MRPTHDRPHAPLYFLAVLLGLSAAPLTGGCGGVLRRTGAVPSRPEEPYRLAGTERTPTFQAFVAPGLSADYTATDRDVVRAQSGRAVSLEGYIAEVHQIHDGLNYGRLPWTGDLHVHVRDQPQPRCLPGGARGTQTVTKVTPPSRPPKTG